MQDRNKMLVCQGLERVPAIIFEVYPVGDTLEVFIW